MIEFLKRWAQRRHFKWMLNNPLGMHGKKTLSKCSGTKKKCNWVLQHNSSIRICSKCGAEDWDFTALHPMAGEPAHIWRRMQ